MHKPANAFLAMLRSIPVMDETNNYPLWELGTHPEDHVVSHTFNLGIKSFLSDTMQSTATSSQANK